MELRYKKNLDYSHFGIYEFQSSIPYNNMYITANVLYLDDHNKRNYANI